MDIVESTAHYEEWLGQQTAIDKVDLKTKHKDMADSPFTFLRATFYRWAQLWPEHSGKLADGPKVLVVGDLHVENYGTWRDREGRLIWGVNDFDESCRMSFANDLVRLAVSAQMAPASERVRTLSTEQTCAAIVDGYVRGMRGHGKPFVLAEENEWLHVQWRARNPVKFWRKIDALQLYRGDIPFGAIEALEYILPKPMEKYKILRRTAGEGSRGRMRFVALNDWCGGQIAREAKALIPSAANWASGSKGPYENFFATILTRSVRCADPFLDTRGQWIVRRLAPDCTTIELEDLQPVEDKVKLLDAMGFEIANIHLGTPEAKADVVDFLKKKNFRHWMIDAVKSMRATVEQDAAKWKAHCQTR